MPSQQDLTRKKRPLHGMRKTGTNGVDMDSHCNNCGSQTDNKAPKCPNCGAIQDSFTYKSRIAASSLAIFGGIFGAHRFFLGQWWAIFYVLFFWTYIPLLVGIIEGIVFLSTSQKSWNKKYNQGISAGSEKGTVVIICVMIIPTVAILGILAAVAVPAYQDYTIRAKMAAVDGFSHSIKESVESYAAREREWPENTAAIAIDPNPSSPLLSNIEIVEGVIYINVTPETGSTGAIVYIPSSADSGITWSCKESTVPSKYLPRRCRP